MRDARVPVELGEPPVHARRVPRALDGEERPRERVEARDVLEVLAEERVDRGAPRDLVLLADELAEEREAEVEGVPPEPLCVDQHLARPVAGARAERVDRAPVAVDRERSGAGGGGGAPALGPGGRGAVGVDRGEPCVERRAQRRALEPEGERGAAREGPGVLEPGLVAEPREARGERVHEPGIGVGAPRRAVGVGRERGGRLLEPEEEARAVPERRVRERVDEGARLARAPGAEELARERVELGIERFARGAARPEVRELHRVEPVARGDARAERLASGQQHPEGEPEEPREREEDERARQSLTPGSRVGHRRCRRRRSGT